MSGVEKKPLFSSRIIDQEVFKKWVQEGHPYTAHTDELWNEHTQSFGVFPEDNTTKLTTQPITPKKNGTNYTNHNYNGTNGVILYN